MIDFSLMFKNLIVGSCPKGTVDVERLHNQLKVTAVLNLQTDADFAEWGVDWSGIERHYEMLDMVCTRVPILDWHEDDLAVHLNTAVDALDALIEDDHRVYVHCTAGVGRAAATVIGYLAWVEGYGFEKAVEYVTSRRDVQPYLETIERLAQEHQTS